MESPDENDFVILFRHGTPMCGVFELEPFTVLKSITMNTYNFTVKNHIFTMDGSGRLWNSKDVYQVWDILHNPSFHGLARCEKMTNSTKYANTADR